jgi:hypothetical protein
MKTKNVRSIICLIIFFMFTNQAWAEDWVLYSTCDEGEIYYDKSSIIKVDKKIVNVQTKTILNKKGRTRVFSILRTMGIAPCSPAKVSHEMTLEQYDCVNEKYKNYSTTIYNEKNNVLVSQYAVGNKWNDIRSDSIVGKLKNIVCSADKISNVEKK